MTTPEIVVRSATADDAAALARLAELDSARPLQAPALVAEIDGRIAAAIEPASGRRIADPFTPTADAVALLELRAERLYAPPADERRGWRRLGITRARAA